MGDLLKKYELLHTSGSVIQPPTAAEIKNSLYENLSILDTKASALMAFDGILIAVASFTVQAGGVFASQPIVPLIVIILTLVAAGLCLFVARVAYPFLGRVTITASKLDFSNELESLDGAVICRTRLYQIAWYLSVAAVALFFFIFVMTLKVQS